MCKIGWHQVHKQDPGVAHCPDCHHDNDGTFLCLVDKIMFHFLICCYIHIQSITDFKGIMLSYSKQRYYFKSSTKYVMMTTNLNTEGHISFHRVINGIFILFLKRSPPIFLKGKRQHFFMFCIIYFNTFWIDNNNKILSEICAESVLRIWE